MPAATRTECQPVRSGSADCLAKRGSTAIESHGGARQKEQKRRGDHNSGEVLPDLRADRETDGVAGAVDGKQDNRKPPRPLLAAQKTTGCSATGNRETYQ